jgi:hypothetical protein
MQVAHLYETFVHSHQPKFIHFPENTSSYLRVTTIHIFINIENIQSNTTQLMIFLRLFLTFFRSTTCFGPSYEPSSTLLRLLVR